MADVTRQEFESRVGVVEREVEGEKMVTRHILEQTRRNGDDLAALKTRADRVERKVDGLENSVQGLGTKVEDLAKALPKVVADTMREVLREQKGK